MVSIDSVRIYFVGPGVRLMAFSAESLPWFSWMWQQPQHDHILHHWIPPHKLFFGLEYMPCHLQLLTLPPLIYPHFNFRSLSPPHQCDDQIYDQEPHQRYIYLSWCCPQWTASKASKKHYITKATRKVQYYWNYVVTVCENCQQCCSRERATLLGKGSCSGCQGTQGVRVCACACMCVSNEDEPELSFLP